MSKSLIFIPALLILISCSKQNSDSASSTDSTVVSEITPEEVEVTEDYHFKGEALKTFESFLEQLDASEADNMVVAAGKFKSLFTGKDHPTCDSAYYLFDKFYAKVNGALDTRHSNDTTNYDSLVMYYEEATNVKFSKKLKDYNDKLTRNGFELSSTEGMTYIGQNRDFLNENLYPQLSPKMVQYLEQLNLENKQGYGEDGGLIIDPNVLVDRAVWWERFNKENPDFIFKLTPRQLQQSYTSTLITGQDNTPLFWEAGGPLDDYYKTAYDYLLRTYPDSETTKLLRPYYAALTKSDTAAINSFRRKNLF